MLKRSHDMPKLILNKADAFTTDTAYRVKTNYINSNLFVFSFINSLTALSAEIEGRSYGGGVLELVPSEINKLLIPIPCSIEVKLEELNTTLLSLPTEEYLPQQDKTVLGGIGLDEKEQGVLFNAWLKLRNRRQRRQI
jgi:hypothetical protein